MRYGRLVLVLLAVFVAPSWANWKDDAKQCGAGDSRDLSSQVQKVLATYL